MGCCGRSHGTRRPINDGEGCEGLSLHGGPALQVFDPPPNGLRSGPRGPIGPWKELSTDASDAFGAQQSRSIQGCSV